MVENKLSVGNLEDDNIIKGDKNETKCKSDMYPESWTHSLAN